MVYFLKILYFPFFYLSTYLPTYLPAYLPIYHVSSFYFDGELVKLEIWI